MLFRSRLRNEPALAVKAFADARALRPKDIVTLVHLGEMQLASGETDAAERTLGEALALDAGSARTLGALGRAALSRNDYATAISRLEQALALAPQASALRYPLSLAYRGAGDATRSAAELAQRGTVDAPLSDPLMERASAQIGRAHV